MQIPAASRSPFLRHPFLPYLAILILTLPWWISLTCPFITLDDLAYLKNNPHVTSGLSFQNIAWAVTNTDRGLYIPLTWLSFMLDAALFGPTPAAFHAANVLLHIASAILLFHFLRRATRRPGASLVVALFFALHPLRVESVAWATERKDDLAVFFGLLTLLAYSHYQKSPGLLRYLLILPLYLLSLLAKPLLVTLPFLLLLLDFWPFHRARLSVLKKIILEKVPLLAVAVAVAILAALIQTKTNANLYELPKPLLERLANAPVSCALYLRDTFYFQNLALFYPWKEPTPIALWLPSLLLILAITTALAFSAFRKKAATPALIGWLWFLGALVPVIGLIQSGNQSRADRFTYFPSIGLFIALCFSWPKSLPSRLTAALAAAATLILLIAMTCQLWLWRDPLDLYLASFQRTRDNWFIASFIAQEYQERGQMEPAIHYYRIVTQLAPFMDQPENNLGGLLAKTGHLQEALTHLQRAAQLDPHNPTYASNEQKLRAYLLLHPPAASP